MNVVTHAPTPYQTSTGLIVRPVVGIFVHDRLWDVRPALATDHLRHAGPHHTIPACQVGNGHATKIEGGSRLAHKISGQLCVSGALTTGRPLWPRVSPVALRRRLPPLPVSIGHVVVSGAQEQVVGADAPPIVAAVQDAHSAGYGAVDQLPGHAVCPLPTTLPAHTEEPIAVPLRRRRPLPIPAPIPSLDLRPEAVSYGHH